MRRLICNSVVITSIALAGAASGEEGKPEAATPSAAHTAAVTAITEAGGAVRRIAQNTDENEVSLALAPPPIEDDLMASVADVENVVWLELQGTAITDAGLKKIGSMKKLRRLHLERTGITDDGLRHLSGLSELEYLNVYGTKVTDKGLESVKSLKKLRKLYVWATEVSDEGMAKLGEAMPELAVIGAAKPLVVPPKPEKFETPDPAAEINAKKIAAPEKLLAAGVAVRVRLPGANHLSLAEVEVYAVGSAEKLKGAATQSSLYPGGEAEKAIDGNRDGAYANQSVTHTNNANGEWWMVKFPKKQESGSIHLWNRADCCGDRLSNAVVEILDEADKVMWSDKVGTATDGGTYDFVGK